MEGDDERASLRAELSELAAAMGAHVAWQRDTGAVGLPTEAPAAQVLALIDVPPSAGRVSPRSAAPQVVTTGPRATPSPVAAPQAPFLARTAEPSAVPSRAEPSRPGSHVSERHSTDPKPLDRPDPEPRVVRPPEPSPRGVLGDERRTRLALVAEQVRGCTKCALHETRTNTVFARGNPFAELCFVGEGPGADEDARGEPFVGAAGQLLDRMIAAMGYARDEVYICNIVKCRPPNNRKPEPIEVATCGPYLAEQLALVNPRVIVALGATAMQGLIGSTEGITRLRGKWKVYKGTIPVMPTFHPAYLLRNPPAKREVWADLQAAMKHLGKLPPQKK